MATTYLHRTPGSSSNQRKWTFSTWIKRGVLSVEEAIVTWLGSGSEYTQLRWQGSDAINFAQHDGSGYTGRINTNAVFRDVAAWYHLVCVWDTDNAAAGDRLRLYVNGVEETSFSTDTNPAQYLDSYANSTNQLTIGSKGAANYFSGSMAHTHFADGQAYAPTVFGETDSTSGIWVPISAPSVTYGTNGFFLKYASGALGTDSSGEGNNMAVSGTMTPTKDNAMNNFCTWNSVGNSRISGGTAYPVTFSNGNTTALNAHATYHTGTMGTIGVKKGKWYYECKCSDVGGIDYIGYAGEDDWGNLLNTYTYANDGTIDDVAYGNTYTSGDIISVAFDADNGTIWFGKNGVWQNSASEAEIEAGTDTNAAVTSMDMTKYYLLAQKGFQDATNQLNTGNGYFGTTAITSAGTNAGEGLFEYDVPSGYYAFNTNNLATYG